MNSSHSLQSTSSPCLSILVPVYNEKQTLLNVLKRVLAVEFPVTTELIVVDDGSTDGSAEILRDLPDWCDISVFFHDDNRGKGAAIQTALRHAKGQYVVIQDADEELNPEDLLPMFEQLRTGQNRVCYGSRFLGDVRHLRKLPTFWANRFLNSICNCLNGIRLTDMNTCYKMMPLDVALRLNLESRGFAIEPEITTKLARMNISIIEHPISYCPRDKANGKKIRIADFFRYLTAMVKFRFINLSTNPIHIPPRQDRVC